MVGRPGADALLPTPRAETRFQRGWIGTARLAEISFGTWYLESVIDDGFAGYCGIRPLLLDGRAEVESHGTSTRPYWNQGFATEAAFASMQLGFDRFALSRLVAIIHPDNRAIAAHRAQARDGGGAHPGPRR